MLEQRAELPTITPEIERISEAVMVCKERWEEIRRLRYEQRYRALLQSSQRL